MRKKLASLLSAVLILNFSVCQIVFGSACAFVSSGNRAEFLTDNILLARDGAGTQRGPGWNGAVCSVVDGMIEIPAGKSTFLKGDASFAMPGKVDFEIDFIPVSTESNAILYFNLVNDSGASSAQSGSFRDAPIISFTNQGEIIISAASYGTPVTAGKYTANERYKFVVSADWAEKSYSVTLKSGVLDGENVENKNLGGAEFPDDVFAFAGFLLYNRSRTDVYYVDNVKVIPRQAEIIGCGELKGDDEKGYSADVDATVFTVNLSQFADVTEGTPVVVRKRAASEADFTVLSEGTDYTLAWGVESQENLTGKAASITAWKSKPVITMAETANEGDECVIDFSGAYDSYGRSFGNAKLNFIFGEPQDIAAQLENVKNTITDITLALNEGADLSAVTGNLVLPGKGPDDTFITWTESSDDKVVTTDGTVYRPSYDDEKNNDRTVTLSGIVSKAGKSLPIELTVTVKMLDLSEDIYTQDILSIEIDSDVTVNTTRINLPESGKNGTKFSWSTSDPSVIDEYGMVHIQETAKTVVLTVKAVRDDGTEMLVKPRSFTINVPAKPAKTPSKGSGSSGGGGGGGGSKTVYVPPVTEKPDDNKPSDNQDTGKNFPDMQDNGVSWAAESVKALAGRDIVSGDEHGNFRPNDNITREEFVKMTVAAFNIETDKTAVSHFSDVDGDKWYALYIAAAAKAEIVNGDGDNFGIGQNITRQDIAAILMRALQYKNIELSGNAAARFADDGDIAEYAREAVLKMSEIGAMGGYGDNTVKPENFATRAETAKILFTVLNVSGLLK